jgi:hypothetical protein
MAELDFKQAICWLLESIAVIPELAEAIRHKQLEVAAACFDRVAELEEAAYTELSKIVGAPGLSMAG